MNAVQVVATVRNAGWQIDYVAHGALERFEIKEGPQSDWSAIADILSPFIADEKGYEEVLDVLFLEKRKLELSLELKKVNHDLDMIASCYG